MFDPSFFELIVICIVALLVLGPDRLPGAIKTLGLWIGRLRRSFNNIKREIEQEVGADDIRRQLRNEAIMEKFNSTKNQVTESIDSVKKEANAIKDDLNLKKEFSNVTGEDNKDASQESESSETGNEKEDEIDPLEKLPTSDPAARTIKPEPDSEAKSEAKKDSQPAPDKADAADNHADSDSQASPAEKPDQDKH